MLMLRMLAGNLLERQKPYAAYGSPTQSSALPGNGFRFGRPATYSYSQRNLEERPDFANGLKAVIALRRDARKEQLHERLESACA